MSSSALPLAGATRGWHPPRNPGPADRWAGALGRIGQGRPSASPPRLATTTVLLKNSIRPVGRAATSPSPAPPAPAAVTWGRRPTEDLQLSRLKSSCSSPRRVKQSNTSGAEALGRAAASAAQACRRLHRRLAPDLQPWCRPGTSVSSPRRKYHDLIVAFTAIGSWMTSSPPSCPELCGSASGCPKSGRPSSAEAGQLASVAPRPAPS